MSKRRSRGKIKVTGSSLDNPEKEKGDPNDGSLATEDLSTDTAFATSRSNAKIPNMPNLVIKHEAIVSSPIKPGKVIERKIISRETPSINVAMGPTVKSDGKSLSSFRTNLSKKNRDASYQKSDIVKVKPSEASVLDPNKFDEECAREPYVEAELPAISRGRFVPNVLISQLKVQPGMFSIPDRPWSEPKKGRKFRKGKSGKVRPTNKMLESMRDVLGDIPKVRQSARPIHPGRTGALTKQEISEISLHLTGESSLQKSVGVEGILDFVRVYAESQ